LLLDPKRVCCKPIRSGMSLLDVLISSPTRGLAGHTDYYHRCHIKKPYTGNKLWHRGMHVIVSVVSIHNNNTTHKNTTDVAWKYQGWLLFYVR
jgi:hypothetical protein